MSTVSFKSLLDSLLTLKGDAERIPASNKSLYNVLLQEARALEPGEYARFMHFAKAVAPLADESKPKGQRPQRPRPQGQKPVADESKQEETTPTAPLEPRNEHYHPYLGKLRFAFELHQDLFVLVDDKDQPCPEGITHVPINEFILRNMKASSKALTSCRTQEEEWKELDAEKAKLSEMMAQEGADQELLKAQIDELDGKLKPLEEALTAAHDAADPLRYNAASAAMFQLVDWVGTILAIGELDGDEFDCVFPYAFPNVVRMVSSMLQHGELTRADYNAIAECIRTEPEREEGHTVRLPTGPTEKMSQESIEEDWGQFVKCVDLWHRIIEFANRNGRQAASRRQEHGKAKIRVRPYGITGESFEEGCTAVRQYIAKLEMETSRAKKGDQRMVRDPEAAVRRRNFDKTKQRKGPKKADDAAKPLPQIKAPRAGRGKPQSEKKNGRYKRYKNKTIDVSGDTLADIQDDEPSGHEPSLQESNPLPQADTQSTTTPSSDSQSTPSADKQ